MKHLCIEYASPQNLNDSYCVQFRLLEHEVVPLWARALLDAQQRHIPIDDPTRFYGFGTLEQQTQEALRRINTNVDIINSHQHIVDRHLTNINDRDTLNYLHHIFEVYHGLLDQQHHEFWLTAPDHVRKALAELNLAVHRCEHVADVQYPRHLTTWYGLPKDRILDNSHYRLFTMEHEFGTVFLNYAEIGKTLMNLTDDNDQYIDPDAFQPFKHYTADIFVRFWKSDPLEVKAKYAKMQAYYQSRQDFFGPWQDCYAAGSIPVAVIDQALDLKDIESRQYIKSVSII